MPPFRHRDHDDTERAMRRARQLLAFDVPREDIVAALEADGLDRHEAHLAIRAAELLLRDEMAYQPNRPASSRRGHTHPPGARRCRVCGV